MIEGLGWCGAEARVMGERYRRVVCCVCRPSFLSVYPCFWFDKSNSVPNASIKQSAARSVFRCIASGVKRTLQFQTMLNLSINFMTEDILSCSVLSSLRGCLRVRLGFKVKIRRRFKLKWQSGGCKVCCVNPIVELDKGRKGWEAGLVLEESKRWSGVG